MEFSDLLQFMVEHGASDLYLTTGAPPSVRVQGEMVIVAPEPLLPNRVKEIALQIMDAEQKAAFDRCPEMNLAVSEPGVGRFRVNLFKQRNQVAMVVRHIKTQIPTVEALGLPPVLTKLVMQKRGLVLCVGGTGVGKSTTLASLIDYRNAHTSGHIVTIEDPIEFIHRHKRSIVNQREVGIDTDSYADALKNTLRQAPDVILMGEIRDRDTMEHAVAFALAGHLVISTLHANSANQALDRIVNFFPEDRRTQLLMDLSQITRGIVCQRLVQSVDRQRVAAVEVLLATPLVSELILKGEFHKIKAVMEKSQPLGMRTFDDALYELYNKGAISLEEALRNADSANNLRLKINLEHVGGGSQATELSLKPDDYVPD